MCLMYEREWAELPFLCPVPKGPFTLVWQIWVLRWYCWSGEARERLKKN